MADDPKKESKESNKLDTPIAPTAEEIEKIAQENMAELFDNKRLSAKKPKVKPEIDFPWGPEEPPKDEKKEEKLPEKTEDDPKADDEKEEKAEEKKKVEKKSSLIESVDDDQKEKPKSKPKQRLQEDDIEAISDRVEQRLKPKDQPKEDKKEDPFEGVTDQADRRKLEALQQLSQTDKYKGRDLVKEAKIFWQSEKSYIAQWRKEHPGEKFVDTADDHQEFYAENEPAITDDEITGAREELLFKRAQDEAEKKSDAKAEKRLKDELEPIKREKKMSEVMPVILQTITDSTSAMISEAVPEFAEIIKKDGITKESVEQMGEVDPIALDLIERESNVLRARAGELARMEHTGQYFKFEPEKPYSTPDGDTIFPHADIINTALSLEKTILKKPEEERIYEGREFITKADRMRKIDLIVKSRMPDEAKNEKLEELEDRYWHIQPSDIHAAFVAQSAARVRRTLDLTSKRVQHLESKKAKTAESEKNGKPVKEEETPIKSGERAKSKAPAAVSAESDMVNTKIPGGKSQSDGVQELVSHWFK